MLTRPSLFIVVCFLLSAPAFAQKKDFLTGMNADLIRSDNDGYFEKTQVGLELNYFLTSRITATGGVEVWTAQGPSVVAGMRWYPTADAFTRARFLFGEDEFSLGAGWAKPMTEVLRFEAMTDFYFRGNFTIRVGLAYQIRKKK